MESQRSAGLKVSATTDKTQAKVTFTARAAGHVMVGLSLVGTWVEGFPCG